MTLPLWLNTPFAETLGWTLLHSLWELAILGALAAAALAALRRAAPGVRYVVALAALLLMLIAPVITFVALQPRTIALQPQVPRAFAAMPAEAPAPVAANVAAPAPAPSRARLAEAIRASLPTAETLYLTGLLVCALRLALGYARLRSLVRHATPIGGDRLTSVQHLATRLGLPRAVRLLESSLVEVPAAVGFLRPAILLPITALTGLTPDQLTAILAHELAHIRRHDHLVIHLQTLIETLLFYHPAVWWLAARIRQEREHCCDDVAVNVIGNRLDYARALASMEHLRASPRHTPAQLVAAARGGALLPRIRRLLSAKPAPVRPLSHAAAALLVFAILGIALYAVGCAHQQNKTVVARADAASDKPQILIKIVIANMDESFLSAHLGMPSPASADGSMTEAIRPDDLIAAINSGTHCAVVSKPSVLVTDGQQARLQIGQELPTPGGQYEFAGIQADVLPSLSADGQSAYIGVTFDISAAQPGATTRIAGVGEPVPLIDRRSARVLQSLANGKSSVLIGPESLNNPPGNPAQRVVFVITPSWTLTPKQSQHLHARLNTIQYRQLINSNATDAARLLNGLFGPANTITRPADAAPAATPASRFYANSDARTNTVVLSGPPDQVKQALDLLNQMENIAIVPPGTSVFFIVHLKNAKAESAAAALNARAGVKPNATRPADILAGSAYVVADPDTNSLVVTTDRLYEQTVRDEIAKLDAPVAPAPAPATQPTTLPAAETEGTMEYVHLANADAADAAQRINDILQAGGSAARGASGTRVHAGYDPHSNSVILSGEGEQVHRALEILEDIDPRGSATIAAVHFTVQLAYGHASELAAMLNARHPDASPRGGVAFGGSGNLLLVEASPSEELAIRDEIARLDVPHPAAEVKLKNLDATAMGARIAARDKVDKLPFRFSADRETNSVLLTSVNAADAPAIERFAADLRRRDDAATSGTPQIDPVAHASAMSAYQQTLDAARRQLEARDYPSARATADRAAAVVMKNESAFSDQDYATLIAAAKDVASDADARQRVDAWDDAPGREPAHDLVLRTRDRGAASDDKAGQKVLESLLADAERNYWSGQVDQARALLQHALMLEPRNDAAQRLSQQISAAIRPTTTQAGATPGPATPPTASTATARATAPSAAGPSTRPGADSGFLPATTPAATGPATRVGPPMAPADAARLAHLDDAQTNFQKKVAELTAAVHAYLVLLNRYDIDATRAQIKDAQDQVEALTREEREAQQQLDAANARYEALRSGTAQPATAPATTPH